MKVRCIAVTGKGLFKKTLERDDFAHEEVNYSRFFSLNKVYRVYGVAIYEKGLNYLLDCNNIGQPLWHYGELFEIVNQRMYHEWYFRTFKDGKFQALWGYKELVADYYHNDDLMERKGHAVDIFIKRKREMDSDIFE